MYKVSKFIVLIFLFYHLPIEAQTAGPGKGNLKIGPVGIHPFLNVTETYSDNLYKNYGGRTAESSWITGLSTGIGLLFPIGGHDLDLGYRVNGNWFSPYSESNYTDQEWKGKFRLEFPAGLKGSLSHVYTDSRLPRKGKETPGLSGAADPFREKPYQGNNFMTEMGYAFGDRLALEGRYLYDDYAYRNNADQQGNWRRNLYGGSLFYRFSTRTRALIDYSFASADYPHNRVNDNNDQSIYLGLAFDPSAKLNGYLKLGWIRKEYEQKLSTRENSVSLPSALVDLKYRLSPDDRLHLSAERTIREDVDTYTAYTTNNFSLTYRHALAWNQKVSLSAGMGYQTLRFDGGTFDADGSLKIRDDQQWSTVVGIVYAMKRWLSFEFAYRLVRNNSNFINYDYRENRVSLGAAAFF